GNKPSVCRDFAVLGYCEKGIDCEEAHIRECPDFATNGVCKNPKCKLPHVIRANRKRDVGNSANSTTGPPKATTTRNIPNKPAENEEAPTQLSSTDPPQLPLNGVNYTFEGGDEFIPLTFVESDDEEEEGEEDDKDEDESDDNSEEEEKPVDAESPDEPGTNPGIKNIWTWRNKRPEARHDGGNLCLCDFSQTTNGTERGHTSEMLQLLKGLDVERYGPRKYILSAGDRLSAKKAAEFESKQSFPSV
ncbi:17398_t:CDS:2, partial [Acaulospora colombiana]